MTKTEKEMLKIKLSQNNIILEFLHANVTELINENESLIERIYNHKEDV